MNDDLREALAAVSHEIWAHWMRYQFSCCRANEDGTLTIPAERVARWGRQMDTPYAELPEGERPSDREQADKILAVLYRGRQEPPADAQQFSSLVEVAFAHAGRPCKICGERLEVADMLQAACAGAYPVSFSHRRCWQGMMEVLREAQEANSGQWLLDLAVGKGQPLRGD